MGAERAVCARLRFRRRARGGHVGEGVCARGRAAGGADRGRKAGGHRPAARHAFDRWRHWRGARPLGGLGRSRKRRCSTRIGAGVGASTSARHAARSTAHAARHAHAHGATVSRLWERRLLSIPTRGAMAAVAVGGHAVRTRAVTSSIAAEPVSSCAGEGVECEHARGWGCAARRAMGMRVGQGGGMTTVDACTAAGCDGVVVQLVRRRR